LNLDGERTGGNNQENPLIGVLKLPGHHAPKLEVVGDYAHANVTAGVELIKVEHALAEAGQFEAELREIATLLKSYRLEMARESKRRNWGATPVTQRPKNKAKARSQPSNRKQLRGLYDQAQGLLRDLQAKGFDPLEWSAKNLGEPGTQRGLNGNTYYCTKPTALAEDLAALAED
jgi:hypothetical protein